MGEELPAVRQHVTLGVLNAPQLRVRFLLLRDLCYALIDPRVSYD